MQHHLSKGNIAVLSKDGPASLLLAVNNRADKHTTDALRRLFTLTQYKLKDGYPSPEQLRPQTPWKMWEYLQQNCVKALIISGTAEEMQAFTENKHKFIAYPKVGRFYEIAAMLGVPIEFDPFQL